MGFVWAEFLPKTNGVVFLLGTWGISTHALFAVRGYEKYKFNTKKRHILDDVTSVDALIKLPSVTSSRPNAVKILLELLCKILEQKIM